MNRASPLCPPAPLLMFRLRSTPSLLVSRDCECHTYKHTHCLMTQTIRKCDVVACYLGAALAKLCMFMVAFCQRIPGCYRRRCSSALCLWTHSRRACLFSRIKLKSDLVFSFFGSICLTSSFESVVSGRRGCNAVSVRPVLCSIQLNCNLSTLSTPAPQSTSLLQLWSCHLEPCASRSSAVAAFAQMFKIGPKTIS